MHLQCISPTLYKKLQSLVVIPVVQEYWHGIQTNNLKKYSGKEIVVAGKAHQYRYEIKKVIYI